jgi:hypothetical protein
MLPTVACAIVAIALFATLPLSSQAAASDPALVPALSNAPTPYLSASVSWNGQNVSSYGSVSSALAIDLAQSETLFYNWTSHGARIAINDVRLEMFYLGFAVTTRDVDLNTSQSNGSVPLTWTPISVSYLLEGVYRLTASLIATNHTTMWSENFYVRGTAPLGFVALLPIVLLILLVYEVYGLARSGRYAMTGRKPTAAKPTTPPPQAPPAQTAATTPPSGGDQKPTEPPAETPPPSGGSS